MHSQECNAHLPQALTWELHVEVKCGTMSSCSSRKNPLH
jgi:hypothetical protein